MTLFPTADGANRIADRARQFGFRVKRSTGGPRSLSAYVFINDCKIRVANHPVGRKERELGQVMFDVHVGEPRPGAISVGEMLRKVRRLDV